MTSAEVWRFAELARNPAIAWRPFREGVDIYPLLERADGSAAAALLRYQPGASVPRHRHPGREQIFVLAGAQQDDHGHYPAGTALSSLPGSAHSVSSPEGCVVLALWELPVEFEASPAER